LLSTKGCCTRDHSLNLLRHVARWEQLIVANYVRLSAVTVQRLHIAVCVLLQSGWLFLLPSYLREFVPYKDIKTCVKCWGHLEVLIVSPHMCLHVYLILIMIEFSSLQDFAGGM